MNRYLSQPTAVSERQHMPLKWVSATGPVQNNTFSKNRIKTFLRVFLLILATSISTIQYLAAQTNIVTNATFDTDLSGWTATGSWTWGNASNFAGEAENFNNSAATDNTTSGSTDVLSQNLTGLNYGQVPNHVTVKFDLKSGNFNSIASPTKDAFLSIYLGGQVYGQIENNTINNAVNSTAYNGATLTYTPSPYTFEDNIRSSTNPYTTVTLDIPWASMPNIAALAFVFSANGDDFMIDNVSILSCLAPPAPTLAIVSQPVCANAKGTINITNFSFANNYQVTPSTGLSFNGSMITAPAGTYTITALNRTCSTAPPSASTTITLSVQPPTITAGPNPTCAVPTGSLSVASPVSGESYTLTPGGTVNTTGVFSGLAAGSGPYTVTSTVSGCTSLASNPITIGSAATGCAQCVTARVYLQGPLANNGGAVGTTSTRPLMRDNIRLSTFDGNNYIPTQDPYQFQTTYVNVLAAFNKVAPHTLSQFAQVAGPQVFTVTGENAIVDWVFVELRNKTNSSSVVATRSALVQRDGDVVDVDGVSCLSFPGVPVDNYYVAIRHRNHLGAMTAVAQTPAQLSGLVDMTDINTPIFDFGTSLPNGLDFTGKAMALVNGYRALWRDNTNADNKVKYSALANDQIKVQADVIAFPGNATQNLSYDAAFGYFNGDVDMNSKVKYTGVANDRLFIQADVLAYPLNISGNLSFDAYLQQLP